jgi:hypothetical protein
LAADPFLLGLEYIPWEGLLVGDVLASEIAGLVLAWLLKHPVHNGRWESI